MRVLLDESMSRFVAPLLTGHEVRTARQMGWAGLKNGALLSQAVAAGFQALVTADRSIEYQQDVARVGLGVVVLVARSNRIEARSPRTPRLGGADNVRPGQVVHVATRPTP